MPGTDDDDEGTRPPPHPLDRLWVHPSELFAAQRGAGTTGTPGTPDPGAPNRPHRRSWRRDGVLTLAAGTVGAVAAVATLSVVGALDRDHPTPAHALTSASTDAALVAAQVAPGVAAVISTKGGDERRGSGIAVGGHHILTTTTVVDGTTDIATSSIQSPADSGASAPTLEVCLADGRRHRATVIGRDAVTGLILLDVPSLQVAPTRFAPSKALRAGDWIIAVGRTSTSGPWVTSGVITAVGGWTNDPNGTPHAGMISTNTELADDARGGALVDRDGRVVGILAAMGTVPGRGSAMPIDMANDVATQLAMHGRASHGALGVRAADAGSGGASVTEIIAGSSAQTAGVRVGDRVIAIDATRTPDTATLVYELRRRTAGQQVHITVVRGTHTIRMTAVLDDVEAARATTPPTSVPLSTAPTTTAPAQSVSTATKP